MENSENLFVKDEESQKIETTEPKKVKKKRKPLSDERKAQLREQLKRGRENSLKKRQEKAKSKKVSSAKSTLGISETSQLLERISKLELRLNNQSQEKVVEKPIDKPVQPVQTPTEPVEPVKPKVSFDLSTIEQQKPKPELKFQSTFKRKKKW